MVHLLSLKEFGLDQILATFAGDPLPQTAPPLYGGDDDGVQDGEGYESAEKNSGQAESVQNVILGKVQHGAPRDRQSC
ncbi:MAG TPA: hypothetical protein VE082_05645, partial [Desulfobaccales bacterium]|nr:hypothetical protein [Desulfobaccales bacterium]